MKNDKDDKIKEKIDDKEIILKLEDSIEKLSEEIIEYYKSNEHLSSVKEELEKFNEALQESEQRWKLLVENSPDIIIAINSDLKIVFINKTISKTPPEKIIGETILIFVPTMFHKKTVKNIKTVFKTGNSELFETPAITKNGKPFFVSVRMSLVKHKKEKFILMIVTDITELREAQKTNKKNNDLLKKINNIQTEFIRHADKKAFFQNLLQHILEAAESEFGFIGEIFYDEKNKPYLKAYSVSDIAWNKASRDFYEKYKDTGFIFNKLNNLYGYTLKTGKMVISNDPASDKKSGGLPKGHPPIKSFLGIPLYRGKEFIGMAGFANRKKGYSKEFVDYLKPFVSVCETLIEANRENRMRVEAEKKLKKSEKQLRNLARRAQTEREKEALRIARNIHDDLGQILSLLRFDLSWVQSMLNESQQNISLKIDDSIERVDHAVKTVQQITTDLRPTMLDTLGLKDALIWQSESFSERTKIDCKISFKPENIKINNDISVELFRVYQEALTNIARHARATKVISHFFLDNNMLTFSIKDNGVGIDEEKLENPNSCGLIGMRERILSWRGNMNITGTKDKGTKIFIEIPLENINMGIQ
ncbi:MAG: GAF domain-containing protein [Spirochaetia bacterium]|nr:GAF domain-containing protein [Spirochaetia bacterium]